MKYFITYTLCLLTFLGCYSILGQGHVQKALLFQVLLLWLLNEVWYALIALPTLTITLLRWIKKQEDLSESAVRRITRLTSVSLLLLPHALFALLYLINQLTQGGFQSWLGLPLSQGLFISAYASCVLLFILAMFTTIRGVSLHILLEDLEEEEAAPEPEELRVAQTQRVENTQHVAPAPPATELEQSQSLFGEKHRRMVERSLDESEIILHQASPLSSATREMGLNYVVISLLLGLVAFMCLAITVQSWASMEGWVQGLLLLMSVVFSLLFLMWVSSPTRTKRHRQRVDYFITNKRAIICEPRKKPRSILWADAPRCHLALYAQGVGNIYLIERHGFLDKLSQAADKLIGESAKEYEETDYNHGNRLNGLIQIAHAQATFTLVERLLSEAQQGTK